MLRNAQLDWAQLPKMGTIIMTIKSPGSIIQGILRNMNVSEDAFATAMDIPPVGARLVLKGVVAITPETALRLEIILKKPAEHWMSLQADYDIAIMREKCAVELSSLTPLEPIPHAEEVGRNGLQLWDSVFDLCSRPFDSTVISRKDEVPVDFLAAYEAAFRDGTLKDMGNLAFNKETGKFGFLLTRFLTSDRTSGREIDFTALSHYMGVELACFDSEGDPTNKGRIYLTAFIDSPAKFKDAEAISALMSNVAFNWNTKFDRDIPSQIALASQPLNKPAKS